MGSDVNKFLLILNGGGWCVSLEDCAVRAKTNLGTSTLWAPSIAGEGITDSNVTFNPFANWNIAYIYYCDGYSFSGYRDEPVEYNNQTLYFSGKRILEGNIAHLVSHRGLALGSHVLLSGHSAGGLATYIHCDYVKQFLNPSATYGAVPDAGFFLDVPTITGTYLYRDQMQVVFDLSNASFGVNPTCIAAYAPSDAWKCAFAQYTYQFIRTPLFIIQSQYDTYQLPYILNVSCIPTLTLNCSAADYAAFQGFRTVLLQTMKSVGAFSLPATNGAWSDACPAHSQAYYGDYYNNVQWEVPHGSEATLGVSIHDWFLTTLEFNPYDDAVVDNFHIDTCAWPCNLPCANY